MLYKIKMKKYINKILHEDASNCLSKFRSNSIDVVLTDPPYFLDKMDHNWNTKKVKGPKKPYAVKHLPEGMKFNKEQGKKFYSWYLKISEGLFKVLKPGGFFFSFSSPRLYHRMTCAVDDSGFEIRDCFIWLYTQNQAKAMSLHHFINKMNKSEKEKSKLNEKFKEWKTPQVKSCYEPIVMAQKPIEGTYLENSIKYNVSLINTNVKQGLYKNKFVSNIMTCEYINHRMDKVFLVDKPKKNEKGSFNNHKTVKPLSLFKYLINLTTKKNGVVLDPFMGSGTTAVACQDLGRKFIGIEINKQYIDIAIKRLNASTVKKESTRQNYAPKQQELFTI